MYRPTHFGLAAAPSQSMLARPKVTPKPTVVARFAQIATALFVLIGGLVHLQLWRSGYRSIPMIGTWFLANVVISVVLAVAVLVRNDIRIAVAGILFSAASIAAIVLSRTVGLFGFLEPAWTDQAIRATTAEIGAIVALAVTVVGKRFRLQTVTVRPSR